MKKTTFGLMITCLSLTIQPLQSVASTAESTSSADKPIESVEAKTLLLRLNEINVMDKSDLKSADKKNLRMEVRSINQRLSALGGGVYISVGAIILIVLLLIILF